MKEKFLVEETEHGAEIRKERLGVGFERKKNDFLGIFRDRD